MAQQKVRIKIPEGYGPRERRAIAQETLDYIRKRTARGKNRYENSWPGKASQYSEAYKKSLDFRVAGKSKNRVNLRLSNDMLTAMDLLDHDTGYIDIGFKKGDKEENDRAEGNIKGTYGQKTPIRGKKRDFLGITQTVLHEKILVKFPLKDKEKTAERTDKVLAAARIAKETIKKLVE